MINKIKYPIVTTIIVMLLLFFVIAGIAYFHLRNTFKQTINSSAKDFSEINRKQTFWKDSAGKLVDQLQQSNFDKQNAELLFKKDIDSIAKILKVKPKTIKEIQFVYAESRHDTFSIPVHDTVIDGIDRDYFTFSDRWIEFSGNYKLGYLKFDSIKTYDNFDIAHHMKKKHLIGIGRDEFISIINNNPYSSESNLQTLKINNKPKRIVISTGIGYSIVGNKLSYTINIINIGYKLFEF